MIGKLISSLKKKRNGTVLIETALIMPFAMVACLGVAEFGSYMLLTQKIQNATMNVADLAAREEEISVAQLQDLMLSVGEVMRPFDFSTQGTVILTGVGAETAADPEIAWQYISPDGSSVVSHVGTVGQAPSLDSNIVVQDNDSIVVAEIVYSYKKSLLGLIPETTIRKTAFYRARIGDFL